MRGSVVGVEGEAGGGNGTPDDGELSSNKAVALCCTIYISKIGFSFFFFCAVRKLLASTVALLMK